MTNGLTRRQLLAGGALVSAGATGPAVGAATLGGAARPAPREASRMKLGLITYNVARDWDLPTIIDHVKAAGWQGVELRTQHAHGVELSLPPAARKEVRQRFADAGVTLWGLGTTCEFQSADAAVVRANVEETKRWCQLAEDLGAHGVKVRPNGLPKDADLDKTLAQIGGALAECGQAAQAHGVEIFLEVHGGITQNPPNIRAILDHCRHPRVGACWNSNPTDLQNGSVKAYFELLAPDIKSCHINDLWSAAYPYRELFALFNRLGYDGFTLCEVGTPIPAEGGVPFLKCYKGLWTELQRG
jgi:sugar phosphate isomerase/epimerase